MSRKTGLDAQVGIATETTFGTFAAPTDWFEWTDNSLKRNDERIESKAKGRGNRLLRADRWDVGRTGGEGDLGFEVPDRGSSPLILPCLGAVAHAQPDAASAPTVWEHTHTLGDLDGLSLSIQSLLPSISGTDVPLSFLGCKVASWELSNAVDDYLALKWSIDAREVLDSEAAAVPQYAAGARPLPWTGAAINLDGAAYDVNSVTLSGDSGLKNDRYFLGERRKKEQLEGAALRDLSGELAGGEFTDTAAWHLFVDGTVASLSFAWTGAVIEGAFNFAVEVTIPAVRFDGDTPTPDDGPIEQPLQFKVLDPADGSEPITIVVRDNVAGV